MVLEEWPQIMTFEQSEELGLERKLALTGAHNREVYGIAVAAPLNVALEKIVERTRRAVKLLQSVTAQNIAKNNVEYLQGTAKIGPDSAALVTTSDGHEHVLPAKACSSLRDGAGSVLSARKERIIMRNFKQWAPWALMFVVAVWVSLTLGQTARSQQPASRPAGRYIIYYHPTNFNRALLLDTSTGSVWELASDSYKSRGADSQVAEIQFHTFQRLGVEGLYQSALDKVQEMEKQEELARQQKLAAPAEESPSVPPDTPK
jgi:hypothetical protein